MAIDILRDATLDVMGKYMTRLSKRQQIVASNVANIDTPGYTAKDISFHATMDELLSQDALPLRATMPEHMAMGEWSFAPLEPEVFEVPGLPMRADRNNVDIDREMLKLGETSFGFSMMSELLRSKFRTIASSINEGRTGV
jgi:flagellar basal-body rod protein FlgB